MDELCLCLSEKYINNGKMYIIDAGCYMVVDLDNRTLTFNSDVDLDTAVNIQNEHSLECYQNDTNLQHIWVESWLESTCQG